MKVSYLWKDKAWRTQADGTHHWIGNPAASRCFTGTGEIEAVHGSFALAWESADAIHLAVDLIGSHPLFYGVHHDTIYISDDAVLIAESTGSGLKAENVAEFRKTGYVTERETLFHGVYSLNPGTCVEIGREDGRISEKEWFQLNYRCGGSETMQDKIVRFDACLKEVFYDLIQRLNGRTALLPLSGGLDSRLAATYLKKLGYEKTVCFSYGRGGNWEAGRSRVIAEHLGYPWLFEEYSADRWKSLIRSEEYGRFLDWSCRGRSLGCLQALPAILYIRGRELVPNDAVVVPGHALDFTLGSHIMQDMSSASGEALADHILSDHYILADNEHDLGGIAKWKSRLDGAAPINAYMQWEYRNRQSKFIANDVRTYEFAGYTFELPFWDIRIQQFAGSLTLEDLMGRSFQREFTKQMVDPMAGLASEAATSMKQSNPLKEMIKRNPLVRKWLEQKEIHNRRYNDTNAFLAWLDDKEYARCSQDLGKKFNLNSIEARDYIQMLKEGV